MQGTLSTIAGLTKFERDEFANARTHAVAREGRDMDEQFLAAGRRFDEAETALVVPLGQLAVGTHGQNFLVS
jgi:hypothetical protein